MATMEHINRATWRDRDALRHYRRSHDHLNEGERRVFSIALERAKGGRLLDIGVGAGRTAALLAPMVKDYVGIDYTPEMVRLSRLAHPHLRIDQMDARDLSAFEDGSFDAVVFSYNGIDSVDAEGRLAILSEASRVLAPGGLFVFSTFHRNYSGFTEGMRFSRRLLWTANPARLGARILRFGSSYITSAIRKHRYMPLQQRDGEHALLLHHAHDFGILVYATTPSQLQSQLGVAGFATPAPLYGVSGDRIPADDVSAERLAGEEYFYVVAQKPAI